jgi:pimeloyl-ACP methyl ester carboxylesterase
MGGPIGVALAKQNPDRVLGLVLIASVGLYPYRAFRRSKPSLAHKILSSPFFGILLRPVMKLMFYQLGFPKGITVESMLYVLHCAHDFSFAEHTENISSLKCPILSVWSENDPLIEVKSQHDLSAVFQNGTTLRFETGKHNPQRDFPKEIVDAMQEWIKKNVFVQKNL